MKDMLFLGTHRAVQFKLLAMVSAYTQEGHDPLQSPPLRLPAEYGRRWAGLQLQMALERN